MSKPPKDPKELLKYTGKTEAELAKEQEDLEGEVNLRAQAMDQEIQNFSNKTDEMKTPEGKVVGIVKRPTAEQFRKFTPPELAKHKGDPDAITYEEAEKYEKAIYALMAELIVTPKHTAEEWRKTTGDEFAALFQAHLFKVRKQMVESVKNFL